MNRSEPTTDKVEAMRAAKQTLREALDVSHPDWRDACIYVHSEKMSDFRSYIVYPAGREEVEEEIDAKVLAKITSNREVEEKPTHWLEKIRERHPDLAALVGRRTHQRALELVQDLDDLAGRLRSFVEEESIGGEYDQAVEAQSAGGENNGPCLTFTSAAKVLEVLWQELARIYDGLRPEDMKQLAEDVESAVA